MHVLLPPCCDPLARGRTSHDKFRPVPAQVADPGHGYPNTECILPSLLHQLLAWKAATHVLAPMGAAHRCILYYSMKRTQGRDRHRSTGDHSCFVQR